MLSKKIKIIILVLATLTVLLCSSQNRVMPQQPNQQKQEFPYQIPLTENWQFWSEKAVDRVRSNPDLPELKTKNWQTIKVPSNWYLQGRDLEGVVWYRDKFKLDPRWEGKTIELVFSGVDYAADVWLNDRYLGFHEGYFQPFSFFVSEQLKFQEDNTLIVKVNSPKEGSDKDDKDWSQHKRLIKGIFSHHDTRPGGAWSLRGQEKNTGGIWAPVSLRVTEGVSIDQVKVTPELELDGERGIATVDLNLTNLEQQDRDVEVRLQLKPENFAGITTDPVSQKYRLKKGINREKIQLTIDKPQLWWTWEHGQANLYRLKIQAIQAGKILDRQETVFGFRTISYGDDKIWRLNGKRMFVRGTNYISSQWLSEMTPAKYAFDLDLMKQANINAIRVHAHIEAEEFYRLCDKAGILVWQDFPLQWGYTDDPAFIPEAIAQGKDMLNLLYNHPSIMAWSLHNEPPWDAEWMKQKYTKYDPQQNRELDAQLFASLQNLDPTRYLHPYSASVEHPWWGWYFGPYQQYAEPVERPILSEFGAQALPNLNSLRRIFTEAELFPDTEEELAKWQYHNFQPHETFEIAKVAKGKNPQEFINNTQTYQKELTQFAAEAMRRQRYQPLSAIFQFMFVENWPSINWGIVDYWRNPKPGYEALKIAYQPVLPSISSTKQVWNLGETVVLDLTIVNDLWTSFSDTTVTYTLQHQWQNLKTEQIELNLEPDSLVKLQSISYKPSLLGDYELVAKILDKAGNVLGQNAFPFQVK